MKRYLPHIAGWIIFIAYELLFIWYSTRALSGLTDYLVHYAFNISLFYVNVLIILPYCSRKTGMIRFIWFVFLVLAELFLFILFKYFAVALMEYLSIGQTVRHANTSSFAVTTFFRGAYFVGLSSGYWFFRQTEKQKIAIYQLEEKRLRSVIEKQNLERELLITEHDFLRSQINPHLLFNSLNFIHNAVDSANQRLSAIILRLSDMMRYALEPLCQNAMVELQQEIDNIQNYIELYRLKSDHRLHLEVSVKGDFNNMAISPVILLPLVENIFKYAELDDPEKKAQLHIHCQNNTLRLHIKNHKNHLTSKPGYGIGLSNVLTRLNKLYKDSHFISIEENEETYILDLTLYLK